MVGTLTLGNQGAQDVHVDVLSFVIWHHLVDESPTDLTPWTLR